MSKIGLSFVVLLAVCISASYGYLQHISGGLQQVSASVNYLWGVGRLNKVYYCKRPCTGNWVYAYAVMKQVDVSDDEVWAVSKNNYVYRRPVDGSGSWKCLSGRLMQVSASGNGYVWGVATNNYVYKCQKPCKGSWQYVSGIRAKQVDAGEEYVYAVYKHSKYLYARPVDGSGHWRNVGSSAAKVEHVTAGANEAFITTSTNHIYRCKEPCVYNRWELVTGRLKQCDATINGLFGVNSHNAIFKHPLPI